MYTQQDRNYLNLINEISVLKISNNLEFRGIWNKLFIVCDAKAKQFAFWIVDCTLFCLIHWFTPTNVYYYWTLLQRLAWASAPYLPSLTTDGLNTLKFVYCTSFSSPNTSDYFIFVDRNVYSTYNISDFRPDRKHCLSKFDQPIVLMVSTY